MVLFDGDCRFCNSAVNFIVERDAPATFRFAPLQSSLGQELLGRFGLPTTGLDSLVLVDGQGAALRSTAALRIARRLPMPWKLTYGLIAIPAPVRDFAYKAFARLRYRLFGRQETCRVPTPETRARFLA